MNDSTRNVNVGIAGSLTMIVLCIGVALLCTSFYRRYKRAEKSDFQLGEPGSPSAGSSRAEQTGTSESE